MMLMIVWLAIAFNGRADNALSPGTDTETLAADYVDDLAAFKRLRTNLFQLAAEIKRRPDLFGPKPETDRTLLRPEIRRQILDLWYPMIDTYLALDAIAEKHMAFYRLKDKSERKQAFHLARAVFLTQYRLALDVIAVLEQNPLVDTILNEPDANLGLPQGVYAHFKYRYLNVVKAGHYAALEAVARHYASPRDPQLSQWAEADSRAVLDAGKGPGPRMTFQNGIAMVRQFGHSVWFPIQKEVAEWMGQTKVWRPHDYLIQPDQIQHLEALVAPGDILLERREWYMTNVGIPGFWTHAALYIGSAAQRDALSNQADVKEWLINQGAESIDGLIQKRYPRAYDAMQMPYHDGRLPQVIEALSPGVSLTSLHHSATCDSLAVLRPRLSQVDRAAAVVRAMRYYGRPYDYAFDFGTDSSLVCTELIVKAYLPGPSKQGLRLPLEKVMGHVVTPANAFVELFDKTFGTQAQQMDLVLFYDGDEKQKQAHEAGLNLFRQSWQRPKWHIVVQYAQTKKE